MLSFDAACVKRKPWASTDDDRAEIARRIALASVVPDRASLEPFQTSILQRLVDQLRICQAALPSKGPVRKCFAKLNRGAIFIKPDFIEPPRFVWRLRPSSGSDARGRRRGAPSSRGQTAPSRFYLKHAAASLRRKRPFCVSKPSLAISCGGSTTQSRGTA